jgi:serine protease Do
MPVMETLKIEAGPDISREFAGLAERLRRSTVVVRGSNTPSSAQGPGPGGGAGVIWRDDGLVITNAHVVRAGRLFVELHDGRMLNAVLQRRDPERDLAALIVDAQGLTVAPIGDSEALRVGELVIAVGHPWGLAGAVTTGIVHALPNGNGHGPGSYLQADIRLAPGNSGGPLADMWGRVVGINTLVAGGLAWAVPSNAVAEFLSGAKPRARLGVTLETVRIPLGSPSRIGLLIVEVEAGSPAERAGLLVGDVLVGVEGTSFGGPHDLARRLSDAARAGSSGKVSFDIWRAGKILSREVLFDKGAKAA